jgi:hypothetical protein
VLLIHTSLAKFTPLFEDIIGFVDCHVIRFLVVIVIFIAMIQGGLDIQSCIFFVLGRQIPRGNIERNSGPSTLDGVSSENA